MSTISLTLKLITVATFILNKESEHKLNSSRNKLLQSYDYIVVGSGSAGGVVAHRLAEDPNINVLLLEAGLPNGIHNDIPMLFAAIEGTQYDWNYTMARQFVGVAYTDGRIPEPRGYVLGGTSSFNGMVYNRANRRTYDHWVEQYGAQGWSFAEVLPYFKKFEKNTDPRIVSNGLHGTKGPIEITSWPPPIDPIVLLHQKAINGLGIRSIDDINGPVQTGTAILQAFIDRNGVRSSVANAYLDPNPFPNNLHILTRALVTRILFNGNTAFGVEFIKNNQKLMVSARREVIVSAGTINSPQLLMLSGIGPKQHLESHNIPVLIDLPVGEHLQNHPAVSINMFFKPQYQSLINSGDPDLTIDRLYDYFVKHTGMLTRHYSTLTYLNTQRNQDTNWPNVGIETGIIRYPQTLDNNFGDLKKEWMEYSKDFLGNYFIYILPILQRIRSFGFIKLQSNNPFDYPIINPKFLTNPQDYDDFFNVTKYAFYFIERSSFAEYLIPHKPIPGCRFCPNQRFIHQCDSYIRCFIQQITRGDFHPVGTCRMGAYNRPDVVVDPRLRVKGINSLRVCDASIMPHLPNGNINAPTIMIGEKCAHLVKQDCYLYD